VAFLGCSYACSAGTLPDMLDRATAPRAHAPAAQSRIAALNLAPLRPSVIENLRPHPMDLSAPRVSPMRIQSSPAVAHPAEEDQAAAKTLVNLHWTDAAAVSPHLVTMARNFKHNGVPVVKLWQADRNLVALGVSPRGVPGIYFTQAVPE
jgi:hypothetical protein